MGTIVLDAIHHLLPKANLPSRRNINKGGMGRGDHSRVRFGEQASQAEEKRENSRRL